MAAHPLRFERQPANLSLPSHLFAAQFLKSGLANKGPQSLVNDRQHSLRIVRQSILLGGNKVKITHIQFIIMAMCLNVKSGATEAE